MQRGSTVLLIVCAAGAFFLPLAARYLMQSPTVQQAYAQSTKGVPATTASRTPVPPNRVLPQNAQRVARPTAQPPASDQPRRLQDTVLKSSTPIQHASRFPAANPPPPTPQSYSPPPQSGSPIEGSVANPSNQQAIATQFSNGPGSVEQTSWTQPQGLTTFPGDSNEPFSDIQGLLFKFAIATTVVLIACVVSLQVASIVSKSRRQPSSELEVCDSIAISRESGVKLIRIGTERIVVGHDRQGLRSMVLLPARFDQLLAKEQAEGDPNGAIEIAGDLRMALANPEDKGWDLNRLKS